MKTESLDIYNMPEKIELNIHGEHINLIQYHEAERPLDFYDRSYRAEGVKGYNASWDFGEKYAAYVIYELSKLDGLEIGGAYSQIMATSENEADQDVYASFDGHVYSEDFRKNGWDEDDNVRADDDDWDYEPECVYQGPICPEAMSSFYGMFTAVGRLTGYKCYIEVSGGNFEFRVITEPQAKPPKKEKSLRAQWKTFFHDLTSK